MRLTHLIDWRRLFIAAVLLGLAAGVYWYWLRDTGTSGGVTVEPARLVEASGERDFGVQKGDLARDFEVSSFGDERFRLSDLHGSPIALKFWATWCGSCLKEFEILKELRPQYEDDGLRVLAVNTGEAYDDALEFVEFLDQPFDWALDPTLTVADAYRVVGFPVSVFIDREGVIQGIHIGEMNRDDMVRFIDGAVGAAPVPDGPRKLRLITTLPRDHVLYAEPVIEPGVLVLRSKSLRCDDVYCADSVVEAVQDVPGVRGATFDRFVDPPALTVRFDPQNPVLVMEIVRVTRQELETLQDPLYEGPVELRQFSEEASP